ncbi:hypothetical protein BN1723_020429, partial [Verticillium longisporum]
RRGARFGCQLGY